MEVVEDSSGEIADKTTTAVENDSENAGMKPREVSNRVGQEQIHDLLFKESLSWQALIYDLINSEQLDPWDIDIGMLSKRYLEKVRQLEEANFFVSSQVLLAASLLLRIKSEILLNEDLRSLDDILFGKKEEKKAFVERLEFDEDVPNLIPRTPLPRFRKVSLAELMSALGKAIKTETRRIKRHILLKQFERETQVVMPRGGVALKDRIKDIFSKLTGLFKDREHKMAFSELMSHDKQDRLSAFVSLLHLDNQQKVWLEQEGHFEEIWILLKDIYVKQNSSKLELMRKEVEAFLEAEGERLSAESEAVVEGEEGIKRIEEVSGFSGEVEREIE